MKNIPKQVLTIENLMYDISNFKEDIDCMKESITEIKHDIKYRLEQLEKEQKRILIRKSKYKENLKKLKDISKQFDFFKHFHNYDIQDHYLCKIDNKYFIGKVIRDNFLNVKLIEFEYSGTKFRIFNNTKLDEIIFKFLTANYHYSANFIFLGMEFVIKFRTNSYYAKCVTEELYLGDGVQYLHHSVIKYVNLKDLDIVSIDNFVELGNSKDPESVALFKELCKNYMKENGTRKNSKN